MKPSRSLVRVSGDPHAWGGSLIRWVDQQNPEATLLTLDDIMEEREWGSIHTKVGTVVSALTTALGSLRDIIAV